MKRLEFKQSLVICLIILVNSSVFGQSAKKFIKSCKPTEKTFYAEIPIKNESGYLFVEVVINKKKYNFLLDTGSPSAISKEIANELKLDTVYTDKLTDASGISESEYYTTVPQVSIGNIIYENVFATINDFSVYGNFASCNHLSGIIGTDIFKNGVCKFTNKSIILTDNIDRLNLSSDGSDLNLTKRYNPILGTKLHFGNDILVEEMLFDSGLGDFIHWGKSSFDIANMAFTIKPKLIKGVGNSHMTAYSQEIVNENKEKALIKILDIGSVTCNNFECYISNDEGSSVGSKILEVMDLTIDWKEKQYYVTKKSDVQNSEFGFWFNAQGIITELWDNSPLKKHNIKLGSKIISINGKKLSEMNICDALSFRASTLKSEKIKLLIDGRDKSFEIVK